MERISVDIIEKIKNIALVVLVFTTILLLYFLWGDASLDDLNFLDNTSTGKQLHAEDVIIPRQIIISMGNGNYTLGNDEFPEIINAFKTFSKQENLLVDEIPKEKYQEVMEFPSIRASFGYNIDFKSFCERYGIDQTLGYNNISTMTELGISKGSKQDSIFIYDGESKKYFRIWSDAVSDFSKFEEITSNAQGAIYYPLKIYLGEEGSNETLIPIDLPADLKTIPFEQDFNISQRETVNSFAQKYFGESFDFVRKVEESDGTIIYMYGYGQKVLIIGPDGSIEYKEEEKPAGDNQQNFISALDIALKFIGSHGGFTTVNGEEITPYLAEESTSNQKNNYKFVFGFTVNANRLYYSDKDPMTIEVTNGQVSYFRRDFIEVNEQAGKQTSKVEKITAINMLALNYEKIKSTLIAEGFIKSQDAQLSFEQLANNIDGLYIGYYKPPTAGETKDLIPAWIVEIGGVRFFMNLYDGAWLGNSSV